MRSLYNSFIQFFRFGILISAFFGNEKAKKWRDGRKGLFEQLEQKIPTDKELVWFHCASLGEFEQARPLLEKIKKERVYFILLTFFSPSGFESKQNYPHADHICYLPLDSSSNAKKFVQLIQPKFSFFAKYEFWFNILKELKKGNHPHFLISGIFRKEQQFFQPYGKWFLRHLADFDHFYLQDQNSLTLMKEHGIEQCSLSGDGRFDRVAEIAKAPFSDPRFDEFTKGNKVIVFGSSWSKENEMAFQLATSDPQLKVIIAPHEFKAADFEHLSKKYEKELQYLSSYKEGNNSQILIIDQMGLLAKVYRYGQIAVIGGGFGKGIHNILEAAVYGIPVLFGPNYRIFKEAWDLLEVEGAKVFKNEEQFHLSISELLTKDEQRLSMGKNCLDYFNQNTGATSLIFNHLSNNFRL